MKLGKRLVFNTALLTASSIVMRCIALVFQVWLTGRIGSAGIGLFQLVMSVSLLASTVAISGIRFACTRLISEEIGLNAGGSIGKTILRCCTYSLFFGVASMVILFLCAEPIGFLWIGDARTVLSLKLLSFSLPFMSLSAVMAGYFTATGRVYKSAAIQITEQLFRIFWVVVFLSMADNADLERSCASVVAGGVLAELLSFVLFSIAYIHDRKHHRTGGGELTKVTGRMMKIAVPLAVSAYARTSLSTLQNLLVPRGLKSAGYSADSALSGYGIIQGMVFPIIMFPSCVLMALAELLVPELTEAQVSGRTQHISEMTSNLLTKCLAFSIGAAAVMYAFAGDLGQAIYSSSEAGRYIRIFALLVPVMYIDMVIDGCLKGLGQMMYSMCYNITEAAIGVLLVYTLLPTYALNGYIVIICFCEILNFSMSYNRLRKVAKPKIRLVSIVMPILCAYGATCAINIVLRWMHFSASESIISVVVCIIAAAGLYYLLVHLCGCLKDDNGQAVKDGR